MDDSFKEVDDTCLSFWRKNRNLQLRPSEVVTVADLQGRRDGDDLLDGATESLDVVVPVEHLPDVEVLHRIVLKVSLSINP